MVALFSIHGPNNIGLNLGDSFMNIWLIVYFLYVYQSAALFVCLCFCKFVLSNLFFVLFDLGTAFVNILLVTNLYRETV